MYILIFLQCGLRNFSNQLLSQTIQSEILLHVDQRYTIVLCSEFAQIHLNLFLMSVQHIMRPDNDRFSYDGIIVLTRSVNMNINYGVTKLFRKCAVLLLTP